MVHGSPLAAAAGTPGPGRAQWPTVGRARAAQWTGQCPARDRRRPPGRGPDSVSKSESLRPCHHDGLGRQRPAMSRVADRAVTAGVTSHGHGHGDGPAAPPRRPAARPRLRLTSHGVTGSSRGSLISTVTATVIVMVATSPDPARAGAHWHGRQSRCLRGTVLPPQSVGVRRLSESESDSDDPGLAKRMFKSCYLRRNCSQSLPRRGRRSHHYPADARAACCARKWRRDQNVREVEKLNTFHLS